MRIWALPGVAGAGVGGGGGVQAARSRNRVGIDARVDRGQTSPRLKKGSVSCTPRRMQSEVVYGNHQSQAACDAIVVHRVRFHCRMRGRPGRSKTIKKTFRTKKDVLSRAIGAVHPALSSVQVNGATAAYVLDRLKNRKQRIDKNNAATDQHGQGNPLLIPKVHSIPAAGDQTKLGHCTNSLCNLPSSSLSSSSVSVS